MPAPAIAAAIAKSGLIKKVIGACVSLLVLAGVALFGLGVMAAAAFSMVSQQTYAGSGDDYPWKDQPDDEHGGGLSPLGYYYRECVDFVAWRINEAAGSTTAPFQWTWGILTPNGGDAYEFNAAWQLHGWPISATPSVGSVAWWSQTAGVGSLGHVAWVKAVNPDGTIVVEEYNWGHTHNFDSRTIPGTAAAAQTVGSSAVPPSAFLQPPTGGWGYLNGTGPLIGIGVGAQ